MSKNKNNNTIRLLHFADAHIDMANHGRLDPETRLPVRVMDYLNALDQIVDCALEEPVDAVIFAGDAYKDRNPHPTYQKAWGERMIKLSNAGIPTILLVGNHDVSPAQGRAHAMHEYNTLHVPHIHVADQISLFTPQELGIQLQVIAIPWVPRSGLLARDEYLNQSQEAVHRILEEKVIAAINSQIERCDPAIPTVLTAHATIQGAKYGSERQVMLGHELILSGAILRRPQIDYAALGHIHKHQSLHGDSHPPIIYPGSIERIDFGEAKEQKGFVLANIQRGKTTWEFVRLNTRRFLNFEIDAPQAETFMEDVLAQLPAADGVKDAICRVILNYPHEWEAMVHEAEIADRFAQSFSFQLIKRAQRANRSRLGETVAVEQMNPLELLELYWRVQEVSTDESETLQEMAIELLSDID